MDPLFYTAALSEAKSRRESHCIVLALCIFVVRLVALKSSISIQVHKIKLTSHVIKNHRQHVKLGLIMMQLTQLINCSYSSNLSLIQTKGILFSNDTESECLAFFPVLTCSPHLVSQVSVAVTYAL